MHPPKPAPARWRSVCRTAHRWIALVSMVLLVPIALSGSLLVWHDALDALINPGRYAGSDHGATQPTSLYLARAAEALPAGITAVALRYPDEPGDPLTVTARGAPREDGPASFRRVYLDPPTARVLDVVDPRMSFVGFLHRFHENLTVPGLFGRQMVGWMGVAMFALALTGIWLWWPRNAAFVVGLRWRRAPATTSNLHYVVGFWISIPLALVSLTGVYLAFPHTARSVTSSFAPMSPVPPRGGAGSEAMRQIALDADAVLAKALEETHADAHGTRPAAIFVPRGGGARDETARRAAPQWRVVLRDATGGTMTVLVDDATGAVRRAGDPLAGDRVAQWMRWIHEGSHSGPVWPCVVFLAGLALPALAVTGLVMWLRGRRIRRSAVLAPGAAA